MFGLFDKASHHFNSLHNPEAVIWMSIKKIKLTAARRQVFSLRAPTHPVNPITNVTKPTKKTPINQYKLTLIKLTINEGIFC